MDAFDILAIGAHPDDVELVMGGTIARETTRGRRVALLDLTRGESGSRGTPEVRAVEAQAAARILGAAHRDSLELPDAGLQPVPEQRDQVAQMPLAPGEVVGVGDGHEVVGLRPDHEHRVPVQDPQREDRPNRA